MDINNEQIRRQKNGLSVDGDLPPMSLVGAVLAAMPHPSHVVAQRRMAEGTSTWDVLAFDDSAVVVGRAEAEVANWSWSTYRDPADNVVWARWWPIASVSRVEVVNVTRWAEASSAGAIVGEVDWRIEVGGTQILLRGRDFRSRSGIDLPAVIVAFQHSILSAARGID